MEHRITFRELFDMFLGAVIGCLALLLFLCSAHYITLPSGRAYNSLATSLHTYGDNMPMEEKEELVQGMAPDLAETIINSGNKVYAPSRNPADYKLVNAGRTYWVVLCNDEIIGIMEISEDMSGQRLMNYRYSSVPFSLRPEYTWEGPISDKPGWLYDNEVYS